MRINPVLEISQGSMWKYVGGQQGCRDTLHRVLDVKLESDGDVIVTVSNRSVMSWMGNSMDFLKQFKPAPEKEALKFNFV